MKALQAFNPDGIYTEAEIESLAVTFVQEDEALSLLDYESQLDVHWAMFRITSNIEHQLGTPLRLGVWFKRLSPKPRAQVVTFLSDKRFGADGTIILHYYQDKQQFRVERNHHLVGAR